MKPLLYGVGTDIFRGGGDGGLEKGEGTRFPPPLPSPPSLRSFLVDGANPLHRSEQTLSTSFHRASSSCSDIRVPAQGMCVRLAFRSNQNFPVSFPAASEHACHGIKCDHVPRYIIYYIYGLRLDRSCMWCVERLASVCCCNLLPLLLHIRVFFLMKRTQNVSS